MTPPVHVYANNNYLSFLYDRKECRPRDGGGNHRCDVILLNVNSSKEIWIIECKSAVQTKQAKEAVEQIRGCFEKIKNARGWEIKKCVVGNTFDQLAVKELERSKIVHIERGASRTEEWKTGVLEAINQLTE